MVSQKFLDLKNVLRSQENPRCQKSICLKVDNLDNVDNANNVENIDKNDNIDNVHSFTD